MRWQARVLAALILLGLAGLCVQGLLATFTPQFQGRWGTRLVCLFTGSACLLSSVLLLPPHKPKA
ncbi:MAG: hypothetical protein ACP5XB_23665 [Isosphaeraceae bacterium]